MRVVTQLLLFFGMVVGANGDAFEWKLGRPTCPSACGKLETTIQLPLTCIQKTRYNPAGSHVASSFCNQYKKPGANYGCPPTSPCATYQWKESNEQCPTECGQPAKTITHTLSCLAISKSKPLGVVVADSFCGYSKPAVTTLYCMATPPCEPICTANQRPCECDEDCCSGICELPNSKPGKSTKGKNRKAGNDDEGSKSTKDSKSTKGSKSTKDTKDILGTCVCRSSGAACAKDAECCYGRCKNYRCVTRRSFVDALAPLSHGDTGVVAAVGAGAAMGLGVILAVGVARRRTRLAKIAAAPQVDYVVA